MTTHHRLTRRQTVSDKDWARTSASWKAMETLYGFHESARDTSAEERRTRLVDLGFDIPLPVIDQWISCHYFNQHTVRNYGWMDFDIARWDLTDFGNEVIESFRVIRAYRSWAIPEPPLHPFKDFVCRKEDLEYWRTHGTWRIPPIVLDVDSVLPSPAHAEIGGRWQLIEGHSRYRYWLAMRHAEMPMPTSHSCYVLSLKPSGQGRGDLDDKKAPAAGAVHLPYYFEP